MGLIKSESSDLDTTDFNRLSINVSLTGGLLVYPSFFQKA
jgi:hypothetical protein